MVWKKIIHLMRCVFMVYLPNIRAKWQEKDSEFEFFSSLTYSESSVEWDWKNEISQTF